jgi:hypothetical protein
MTAIITHPPLRLTPVYHFGEIPHVLEPIHA